MKPASEQLRYDYPGLSKDSLLVDCGAYKGEWSAEMHKKYGCRIVAMEPIKAHFDECVERIGKLPGVQVMRCALGGTARHETFHIQNNSSGIYATSGSTEMVPVVSVAEIFGKIFTERIEVLKLNVEGMEFEILEAMIFNDLHHRIENIQVQFHWNFPFAQKRFEVINSLLTRSHPVSWGEDPTFWINYKRS